MLQVGCGMYAAACVTRNFFKTQNPQLINKAGFKSKVAYNGVCTVTQNKIFSYG